MLEQAVRFLGSLLFDGLAYQAGALLVRLATFGWVVVDSPFAENVRHSWLGTRRRPDGSLALSADAAGYLGLTTLAIAGLVIVGWLHAG
ncbi:hypothetical protein IHQ68_11455 [Chelatococcus sambhunathii]|uniref:Uncharacterized protein n=1 Tax=Chelatococcus sambhunathii TaxID=363953 RepID=A0ABU1DH54_9HYPH|nr:hypothetical protein [Chelatococcus sambhunathii]MDR4307235.1 hypothetical protein [Chelatococcus sambhunathii]